MELVTRDFGKVEINKNEIINFPDGIPGFLNKKKFVLLNLSEDSPFIILQSTEEKELAFITVIPWDIIKDYEFDIGKKVEEDLKIKKTDDVIVLTICSVKDIFEDMTVNLAAPVVINIKTHLGKQIILDNDLYPVRYQLFNDEKIKVAE